MDAEKDTSPEAAEPTKEPRKITIQDHTEEVESESEDDAAIEQELASSEKLNLDEDDNEENGLLDDSVEENPEDENSEHAPESEGENEPAEDDSELSEPEQEHEDTEVESVDDESVIDPEKSLEELDAEAATRPKDVFEPDPEIDAVVDDIVRAESDESLEDADAKIAAFEATKPKRSLRGKIAAGLRWWWNHKILRWVTILLAIAGIAAIALLPMTRYAILNAAGVRVNSSMRVLDSQTRLPLKNINVSLQNKTAQTDDDGNVNFSDLKLGKSKLAITKIGYADNIRDIVLGWGSNPIGDQEIIATGEQFIFIARDWLSGDGLQSAEAESGESSAKADETGKITLTVGEEGLAADEVRIRADGYREEVLSLNDLQEGQTEVKLVPARQHAFVSNRNGQFDLYTIDADGKNEKLLLEATGNEREVPTILPHPNRNVIAFVSSRSGEQNSDGFVLDELFMVDTATGISDRIARSEQLQLVGWYEDTIVFWQVVEGTSRANAERSKLISYNQRTTERVELAGANYFNDVRLIDGIVYYAVSSFAVPQSQAKLFTVNVDGSNKIKLVDQLVYNIYRTAYDTLLFAADGQKWYQEVGRGPVSETPQQAQPQNKRFVDSPNGERTAWVEVRDGRGVLLVSQTEAFAEERILTLPGLDSVSYWLNDNTLIFRVIRSTETADYVVYIDAEEPAELKIIDVTASSRLYY